MHSKCDSHKFLEQQEHHKTFGKQHSRRVTFDLINNSLDQRENALKYNVWRKREGDALQSTEKEREKSDVKLVELD